MILHHVMYTSCINITGIHIMFINNIIAMSHIKYILVSDSMANETFIIQ